MKRYESYMESGISWLGSIPAHWKMQRAKYMFKKEKREVRPEDKVVTCFRDGQVTLRENRRTTGFTESITELGYQGIRKGDLVIHQMDAFAGSIGVSDSDGKGTSVYHCCTPKGAFISEYYAFVLREMARAGFIQSLYRGIRERSSDFNFQTFGNQYLPIPPKDEQICIAAFLDKKLSLIESWKSQKEKQIQALNELKQAEIASAVTKGLNTKVKMKDSEIPWLGSIPIHWEIKRAKYMFKKEKREVRPEDKVVTCFRDGQVTLRENRRTTGFTESITELGYQGIRKGDLVIHQMDAFAGSIGVSDSDGKGTSVYHCCTPKGAFVSEYYALVLREMARTGFIQSLYRGIRERSSDFNFQTFGNQFLPIPPKEEQIEIVSNIHQRTDKIDKMIVSLNNEINHLLEYKQRLISDVVTGQINVQNEVE